uniref:Uncharacterized protein n=1 Tax=Oryza brachyantha TaxID=4533 RepID=J3L372_ORYBR
MAALREELKDLEELFKAEKDERKADQRNPEQLDGKVNSLRYRRYVRPWLEEEVDALRKKAAEAAAGPAVEEESVVPPPSPEERVAWLAKAGAVAGAATVAAAAGVIYLRLTSLRIWMCALQYIA